MQAVRSDAVAATLDSKGADACMNSDPLVAQYVSVGKGYFLADYRIERAPRRSSVASTSSPAR